MICLIKCYCNLLLLILVDNFSQFKKGRSCKNRISRESLVYRALYVVWKKIHNWNTKNSQFSPRVLKIWEQPVVINPYWHRPMSFGLRFSHYSWIYVVTKDPRVDIIYYFKSSGISGYPFISHPSDPSYSHRSNQIPLLHHIIPVKYCIP